MKIYKHIPVIMALCVAAAVCGGCTTTEDDGKKYDALNAKFQLNYSQIVLTVTNTIDEDTVLTGKYTMEFSDSSTTVTYRVERLPEVSLDSVAAEKITLVGEAKIEGGNVTYLSGDEVPLDALTTGTGFTFKSGYFKNTEFTDMYLIADVVNPSGFTGAEINCTEMKVNVTFLVILFDMRVTYTGQEGNHVEYFYTFAR